MTATNLFHVGFIVHDLDLAMERFGKALNLTWTEKAVAEADMWEPDRGHYPLALDIVYSKEGPPHIELLEAQGDSLYRASMGEGFHHLGGWASDPDARTEELEAMGLPRIGTQYTPEGEVGVSYFEPAALHEIMLEIVNEGQRGMLEKWLAGGPYDG